MAIKKSELYSSIWKSCDELRGGMDASQYKDYVLVLLFVKYVSDKYANKKDALIDVPKGGSFNDMAALKGNKDIGEKINTIIGKLAEANDLKGVIDVADFDDSAKLGEQKEKIDKLSNLIAIFENDDLDFSKNRAEGDDLLGDAYEYLMRHFATESGKSKGQFYTPAEVSRIMAKVIGISQAVRQDQTIYDPTCGSGSLLLKAASETPNKITIYGQEKDNATVAMARMNMILHGNPTAEIKQGNTLSNPLILNEKGGLKTFDFAVANPPFSDKAWSNGIDPVNDIYERFMSYGIPPRKNGDYSFLLHLIRSLKSNGKGAIILPHGVLFRGNVEADIRKKIIERGYIKGIIGLPPNLFYGTGIPACIVVLDKENAENRKSIFIIDASKGFEKDGNKNRLREQDIHKIVDVFTKQIEIPKYSKIVAYEEIEKNEYNLNIPRYIDSQEDEDLQDIEAHLVGDIPQKDIDGLEKYWKAYPTLRDKLFGKSSRKVYFKLKISKDEIKQAIYNHPEFISFSNEIDNTFMIWKTNSDKILKNLQIGMKPKEIIYKISEDILDLFSNEELIDRYDIYQHLMTYWNETMQDDVYIITQDGWKAEPSQTNGKKDEWECELIPKEIIINKYFTDELTSIENLETELDNIIQKKEEMEEEHGGEEGYFTELDKVNKAAINNRLKEIKKDNEALDEIKVLEAYLGLLDEESLKNKKIKELQKELDKKAFNKYPELADKDIKALVIDDKWMTVISNDIKSEMNSISQRLTNRIKELAERYESPLPEIEKQVTELEKKVDGHLKSMGYVWK